MLNMKSLCVYKAALFPLKEPRDYIQPCQSKDLGLKLVEQGKFSHKKEMASVQLMWFRFLHIFLFAWISAKNQPSLYA